MEGGQADFEGSQFCALEMEMQRTLLTRSLHVTQGQGRYFAVNGILLVRCMVVETSPPRTRLEHQPLCCWRKTTLHESFLRDPPCQDEQREAKMYSREELAFVRFVCVRLGESPRWLCGEQRAESRAEVERIFLLFYVAQTDLS